MKIFKLFSFILILLNLNTPNEAMAQKQISNTISHEVCNCVAKEPVKLTTENYKGVYQKCLIYSMTKHQKEINSEFNLKQTDSYQKGLEAGEKLRKQVDELVFKNCELHRRFAVSSKVK